MHKRKILALLASVTAVAAVTVATPASASTTCTIPYGAGTVTPNVASNKYPASTVTAYAGSVTCTSLDGGVYTAKVTAAVYYSRDNTLCNSSRASYNSKAGQNLVAPVAGTCSTPPSSANYSSTQYLLVSFTTSNGISVRTERYPIL